MMYWKMDPNGATKDWTTSWTCMAIHRPYITPTAKRWEFEEFVLLSSKGVNRVTKKEREDEDDDTE